MLEQLWLIVQIAIIWLFGLNGWNGVITAHPAIEINLAAMGGTKGMEFLRRWLGANRAGPFWFQTYGLNHQTLEEAVFIHVCITG